MPGRPTTPTGRTLTSQSTPSLGAAPSAGEPAAEHRIAVRMVDGAGEFFDRLTGERFVPRGVNLIRLSAGNHSTLNPADYDPERIETAFTQMAADGYNVVRIFLNSRPGGMPGSDRPLSETYVQNAIDVLQRAQAHGLQVMFTQDWLPESSAWSFLPIL